MPTAPGPSDEREKDPRYTRLERWWFRLWGRIALVPGTLLALVGVAGAVHYGSLQARAIREGATICVMPGIDCRSSDGTWVGYAVIGASLVVAGFGVFLIVRGLRAIREYRKTG